MRQFSSLTSFHVSDHDNYSFIAYITELDFLSVGTQRSVPRFLFLPT
jgi:hypothetical protein